MFFMKWKIKLMRLDKFDEFKNTKDSIRNISYDESNQEYMSNSKQEIFNFDKVKCNFANKYYIKPPKSVDGCMQKENSVILIEFKNGNIDGDCKKDVCDKIFSSMSILSIIVDEKISNLKHKCQFILVYNQNKNGDLNIYSNLNKDANQHSKVFDLSGYEKLCFNKTYILSENKFETFLQQFP